MVKKLIDIDENLWIQLKVFAVKNRFKIGDVLNDILEKFLNEVEKR